MLVHWFFGNHACRSVCETAVRKIDKYLESALIYNLIFTEQKHTKLVHILWDIIYVVYYLLAAMQRSVVSLRITFLKPNCFWLKLNIIHTVLLQPN